jgi:hypothetical protein
MSDLLVLVSISFIVGVGFGGYIRPRLSKLLKSDYFNDPADLTAIFDNKNKPSN